ncbi:hypothetical protein Tco_1101813 [Tanacetum coccineum]
MMTTEYCPTTEIQRMEQEAYNNRFHELVLMCPELVSTEKKKIEKYIRGFPEGIKGNVTSSKPATLHDAINMARELIEQGVQAKALRIGDSNKRKWEDQQGNNYHQQQNRRQEAAKVYVAAPAKGRGYTGNLPCMSEDIQCAGSDTRPPMLDRTDFESWQQRIRLYCLGKDNGENIMKSINEGPFHMGTVSDVIARGTEGAVQQGPVRARVLNDLSAEEKERYKADIRATNILLQGIPKDIYSLINHYTDVKDIWENVKMILEGSELTKDDSESQLYDEFKHFRQIKGETIQGYYVR